MIRRLTIPAMLMSSVLVFAACGGDDDDAGTGAAADSTETDSAETGDSTETGESTDVAGGDDSAAYCAFATDAAAAFASIGATSTPEDFEAAYDQVTTAIEGVGDNIPAEIADAFPLNTARFEAARAAFAAVGYDPALVDDSALDAFTAPEYAAATEAVDTYDVEVCGIAG